MKISKITINNFKSIGESKNMIRLEKGVTALIGKNECGKSNVLDAIYAMGLTSPLKIPVNSRNRITNRDISYVVEMFVTPDDAKAFDLCEGALTAFSITSQGVSFFGELSKLFADNTEITILSTQLCELVSKYRNQPQTKILHERLKNLSTDIFFYFRTVIDNSINEIFAAKGDQQLLTDIRSIADKLNGKINNIYSLFPTFYKYSEIGLQDGYPYEQISSLWTRKNVNKSLEIFFRAAKVDDATIQAAVEDSHAGVKGKARDKIQSLIDVNINQRFNDFYGQNIVRVKIVFNDNKSINITVESDCGLDDNPQLNLSEQSNGLKWYLSFFIDILSNELEDKPILFLIDEPGVYLHVDAQSALLKFFDNLTKDKCSLIYSTHSPLMLNSQYPASIRVVQKVNGFTEIINKYYSNEIEGNSKLETLSPFLKGVGASLSNTIFPLFDKLCLITEGITDKFYIDAMVKAIENRNYSFYIVPSISVSNINQLASIFIGWGLKFKILLDYDKAGFDEYKKLTRNLGLKPNSSVYFVNQKEYKEGIKKAEYETIESLVAEQDMQKLESWTKYLANEVSKTILANDFYNNVATHVIELSNQTKSNFITLFDAICSISDKEK